MFYYMADNKCKYGILSTFERTWICMCEKENGSLHIRMKIAGPFASSQAASLKATEVRVHDLSSSANIDSNRLQHATNRLLKLKENQIIEQPFLKIVFLVYSLTKKTDRATIESYESEKNNYYDDSNDSHSNGNSDSENQENRDPSFNPKKKIKREENDYYDLRSHSRKQQKRHLSLNLPTPPSSTSPNYKQKPTLLLPTFIVNVIHIG